MKKIKIGIFLGSFRKLSHSRKIANVIAGFLTDEFEMIYLEFGHLDLYNQTFENNNIPKEWEDFRNRVRAMDGFLFVTPEYNCSFPPVLKTALDIGSYPYGNNPWGAKPGAILSISPSHGEGAEAKHYLRQWMVYLNIYLMQQPEVYLGNLNNLFDSEGRIKNDDGRDFFSEIAAVFAEWVKRFV